MGRSTVHYADNKTNNALKKLHNKLRPAGTPVQRVEYIIELLLLRIFETKIKQDEEFKPLRKLFSPDYKWQNPRTGVEESNENRLFSYLPTVSNDQILTELNDNFFPFYASILTSARQVFTGNPPQKVQDQLVLIEEVFSNSNFTNNVNSGNLGEVISIVANDIEEARLLKTDLLGDAIESALSETGGTKDVGLFRTPDHVRHFMTALVEPTYDDVIFDPACGTGGFLYDAFEFVMRRIDPDREWPGEKAHSELAAWFDEYFKFNQLDFPSFEQTTQFYRNGVTGVEYLGMIRKMAAINFYIRGLNPANIVQGDSLAFYRPVTDHESKSAIIANPPFGALRDQESYPDVWSEYSKESETTILFVKLIFEHLKKGARCAVVVSEGFHTWDQFSAKALRKMLLDEANLKAVISLPQGLFVSKNGQGPKTSILIFEKGEKTDWTWFYKVTNDGYTMGTNRKEQAGSQLVECLTLYHEYVKHGKQPPESKNQFCIPVDWIKTLDPRIKEKIKLETRTDMEAKGEVDREKKEKEWDKKIKAKKATEEEKQQDLQVFDQMLENRIQNEIAKRIDKAYLYSFNLANYKSTLSESQIEEWKEALKHIQPNGATSIDDVYRRLSNGKPENSLPYLSKLDPINALAADIAREYVSNLDNDLIAKHKELNSVKEILKSGAKYPFVKLGAILEERTEVINLDEEGDYLQLTVRLWGKGVSERGIKKGSEIQTKRQNVVREGDIIISRIDARNGAFGLISREFDGAIVSNEFPVFKVDTNETIKEYVVFLLTSPQFYKQIEDTVEGASGRRRLDTKKFLDLEIPLPLLEEQVTIIAQAEKQKAIIEGADLVLGNWEPIYRLTNEEINKSQLLSLGDVCSFEYGEPLKESDRIEGEFPVVGAGNIIGFHNVAIHKGPVIVTGRRGATSGSVQWVDSDCYVIDTAFYIEELDKVDINKRFLFYTLVALNLQKLQSGGAMPGINRNDAYKEKFYLPPIDIQKRIVSELDRKMQVLEELRIMRTEAERKIDKILAEVWGVEFVESSLTEAVHEQEN